MHHPSTTRPFAALILSNVLGGVGVASGIAVGSLLVVSMSTTGMAGIGQALSVLGAALMAVPLAQLAARRGRRRALVLGYAIAVIGAALVLAAAVLGSLILLFIGLLAFGAAQATNLQSRYAASELFDARIRGTMMSIVMWATTIGSVTGPNLASLAGTLGASWGIPALAGPYLFSLAGFALAGASVSLLYRRPTLPDTAPTPSPRTDTPISALAALRWAAGHPVARFAVALIVVSHATMVGIMSMTPVHLGALAQPLTVIGLVISLHILGMYALSPAFGWLADRVGALKVALVGLITLGGSALLAFAAPTSLPLVTASLILLGLGWSAGIISASVLLAGVDSGDVRVPLQGATDALMNYAGAASAIVAGLLLSWIGFGAMALSAFALLLPVAAAGEIARRSRRSPGDTTVS